jgi:shikimate dehydrogenase
MRLFGLIGYPLEQSFSKAYFDEKFRTEGLDDCQFENFPLASIDELPALLSSRPELEGFAVTIPYKKAILKFLHKRPEGIDACNCVRINNGDLIGYNTDHIGFEKSLLPLLGDRKHTALVLGSGGAKEAVVFTLERLQIPYQIVSRSGEGLPYADLNDEIIRSSTLIINTTPLGMYPNLDSYPDIPYSAITPQHILYDLVYNPAKTLFLQKGEGQGAVIKNGYEMLVIQAEENLALFLRDESTEP